MEKIREDDVTAQEPSHSKNVAAQGVSVGRIADSGQQSIQRKMEDIEINLRSISHDFMTMFVEAEAQLHLLAHSEERSEQLQDQLSRAETHIGELEDDVLGAKSTVESLRAENLSLRRRIEELTELKDASSIPQVCEGLAVCRFAKLARRRPLFCVS